MARSSFSFLARFAVLEGVVAAGQVGTPALMGGGLHSWGSRWWLVAVTLGVLLLWGMPGTVLLALAAETPAQLAAACVAVVIVQLGFAAAVADGIHGSSTAGLLWLWFPVVLFVGGAVAMVARQVTDR